MPLSRHAVLIVEDDADLRRLFADTLKVAGFNITEASDGTQALRIVESAPPDVVVLDIGLPTLDGYSVREEIAANASTRDIPVIVATGGDVNVKRLKPARFLRKPIEPAELVAAVRASIAIAVGRRFGIDRR